MKTKRKGFTIVELVIVIAVIAILAAVLIPVFAGIINKANESTDTQLVCNLNTVLAADSAMNGKHENMQSALDAVNKSGFDVAKIMNNKATENTILWDSKNDVFCYLKGDKVEYIPGIVDTSNQLNAGDYMLWKIYTASEKEKVVGTEEKYSAYLSGEGWTGALTVSAKGIDVGKVQGITSVTYNGSVAGQNVIVRTDGETLTVNAANDDVKHYGFVGELNVTAVRADHCYHEYGFVGNLASFGTGKFVAESGAEFHQTRLDVETELNDKSFDLDNGEKYRQHYYVGGQCAICHADECQHVWGEWTTSETAHEHVCTVCNKAYSGNHDTNGEGGKCSVCGYISDPCAEGHTVESWTVIQEPTCTEAGYKVGTCTVCNELRVEELPAAHNYSTKWYANNYSHYHICYECYDSSSSRTNGVHLIDKEDHDDVNGYCSVCGLEHSNAYQYVTDNCEGHNMIYNVNRFSNMSHDGHCKWCGYSVTSENHDTDGEGGCCSKCGYKAHEHDSDSWTTETAATCTQEGKEKGTCKTCGITIRRSIPATGHTITTFDDFDVFNHKGTCDVCHVENITQSHQYTLVSSDTTNNIYHYKCDCGVLMEVSGTANPDHEHKIININYDEWGKTQTTIDGKAYTVWICTCGGTSSCGAKITYYVPVKEQP